MTSGAAGSSANTATKRVSISKRLRFEVFKRDGFQCQYCGAVPPSVLLQCDHIEPVAKGGKTESDNLITSCQPCNSGKSDRRLSDIPQALSDRAAEVIEREAQIAGYQAIMKERRMRIAADAQEVVEMFCALFRLSGCSKDDFVSIKRFIEKLGLEECLEAAERAHQKDHYFPRAFRYFCGICWGKIRELPQG